MSSSLSPGAGSYKQEAERLGNPELPPMPDVAEHNALSDAREVRYRAGLLAELAAGR